MNSTRDIYFREIGSDEAILAVIITAVELAKLVDSLNCRMLEYELGELVDIPPIMTAIFTLLLALNYELSAQGN
jgi:hypothetical protein